MSFWFWWWLSVAAIIGFVLYGTYMEESRKSKDEENQEDLYKRFNNLQNSLVELKKLSAEQNKNESPEPTYEEDKFGEYLKQATRLKKHDINEAIIVIKKALNERKSYSFGHKKSAITKLASYIQLSGDTSEALKTLNTYYKQTKDEAENYYMRAMDGSILLGHMASIIKKAKKENPVISYQSTCLYIIALACQGRWSVDDQREFLVHYIKSDNYNQKINEYLFNNAKALITFNKIGLMFFELDGDKKMKEYWRLDRKINESYDSMINEIDSTIEEELLKYI